MNSSEPLPKNLHLALKLALDNLALAALVCEYLIDQKRRGDSAIPAEVFLRGTGKGVHIPGTNCGFFTTPIVHSAAIDVRRILDFLMLKQDQKTSAISTHSGKKYPDDLFITDLGAKAPSPDQLADLSLRVTGKLPNAFLADVIGYANKGLAHFTSVNDFPELPNLIDAAKLMKETVLVFVYDAKSLQRPHLQPATITT